MATPLRYTGVVIPVLTNRLARSGGGRVRADGKAALYVGLHKVLGVDVFADALDVEDSDSFSAWKASGGELTVFVDSLDEAVLGTEDGIRRALHRLGRELGWPTTIISRPLFKKLPCLNHQSLPSSAPVFRLTPSVMPV